MLKVDYVNKFGNWYKYKCPKGISAVILKFTKNLMRKEGMSANKVRRFNKVYISCKRTETSVFYKILVNGNKNLVCFDMSRNAYSYKWYNRDEIKSHVPWIGDSSLDCSSCGYPNYILERRSEVRRKLEKNPPLLCHESRGEFKRNREYNTINTECYQYIDSIKKHIPIRVLPKPVTIGCNRANTFMLIIAIRNKKKEKRISTQDDLYIFNLIKVLPFEMIVHIVGFLRP